MNPIDNEWVERRAIYTDKLSGAVSLSVEMPRRHIVSKENGLFTCPVKNCGKQYGLMRSLRYHCKKNHFILISTIVKRSPRLEQHYRREKQRKRRGVREPYGVDDLHLGLVEVKQSTIPNRGRGVFATKDLKPGDVVLPPSCVASLINREYRKKGVLNLRKNIVFDEMGFANVIKKIKAGKELITTSRQYRTEVLNG